MAGRRPLTRRAHLRGLGWLYRRATARWRPLPDFVIVGAQRCGTSWTYGQLAGHPSIRRAWRKEVHFFDRDRAFGRGAAWYRAHFPRTQPGTLTGEATPSYLFVPEAVPRLAALVPRARLLVLLRNPVDRAHSHYEQVRRLGYEARPVATALALAPPAGGVAGGLGPRSYLLRGHYADQLERLFACFPREQALIVASEELLRRPAEVLGGIVAFLGLPPAPLSLTPGEALAYRPLPPPVRAALVEYFRPHNARLYALLGRELEWDR